ncbi:hypothetical protein IT575_14175 [bacterium]|nr:hypothetical protein [bacterium]
MQYEWDLDGDTSTGTNGFEVSSTQPDVQAALFSAPGERRIRLRVTDDGGLQKVATLVIVSHGWAEVKVADVNGTVAPSLAQIGKGPAIAFCGSPNFTISYARSDSEFGDKQSDWSLSQIAADKFNVESINLVQVKARPALVASHENGSFEERLHYYRSPSGDPLIDSNWDSFELAGIAAIEEGSCDLAVIAGNPAIVVDSPNLGVVYSRSAMDTGADASDWVFVSASGQDLDFLSSPCLQEINGRPAFVSRKAGESIVYSHSSTPEGMNADDWSSVALLEEFVSEGAVHYSLAQADGNPAIAFGFSLFGNGTELRFFRSTTPAGDSLADWQSVFVDDATGSTDKPGLLQLPLPLILALDIGDQLAYVYESSSPDGTQSTDWGERRQLSSSPVLNYSHIVLDGRLAIAFYEPIAQEVRYGILF